MNAPLFTFFGYSRAETPKYWKMNLSPCRLGFVFKVGYFYNQLMILDVQIDLVLYFNRNSISHWICVSHFGVLLRIPNLLLIYFYFVTSFVVLNQLVRGQVTYFRICTHIYRLKLVFMGLRLFFKCDLGKQYQKFWKVFKSCVEKWKMWLQWIDNGIFMCQRREVNDTDRV